jgi:homoserine O-acetyltransferase
MPNALLRPYESAWGHCVATPGRDRAFMAFLNECATELLRA